MSILSDTATLKKYILNSTNVPSYSHKPIIDGETFSNDFLVENINNFIQVSSSYGLKLEDFLLKRIIMLLNGYISAQIYNYYIDNEYLASVDGKSSKTKTYLQYSNSTDLFEYFNHIKDTSFVLICSGLYYDCFRELQFKKCDNVIVKSEYSITQHLKLISIINNCEFYLNSALSYNSLDILILKGYNINVDLKIDDDLIYNLNKINKSIPLDNNVLKVCDMSITFKKKTENNAKLITLQQCEQINYDTI